MNLLDFKKAFTTAKHSILLKKDLDKFEIAKLMHQLVNDELPPRCSSFFTPIKVIHKLTTRLALMKHGLYITRFRSSFEDLGVKVGNLVLANLQKLPFNRSMEFIFAFFFFHTRI